MREQDEDEAWRAIVANFGERARLDDDTPVPGAPVEELPAGEVHPDPDPLPDETLADEPEYSPTLDAPEDRFVPPPPPPLPRPQGLRGAAWVAVLGSPIVLLVCTLVSIDLPTPVAYALVAAFLGGFTHLLLTMPQGPRDPFDDGAQV